MKKNKSHLLPCAVFSHALLSGCMMLAAFLLYSTVQAQEELVDAGWSVVSPQPGTHVTSGELYVVVTFKESVKIRPASLKLFLDGSQMVKNVKIIRNQITFLYMEPIGKGVHDIELEARSEEGPWLPVLKIEFHAVKKMTAGDSTQQEKKITLAGSFSSENKRRFVSGNNTMSQEAPYSHQANLNIRAKIGKMEIPLRVNYTTDEDFSGGGVSSRNYFQTGIRFKKTELLYGDHHPVFDPMILNGMRTHGWYGKITTSHIKLQLLSGSLSRPIEGIESGYVNNFGFLPFNISPDSTFVIPGIYKRSVRAARLQIGNIQQSEGLFGITVFKAKDDTTSIQYGQFPKDNFAVGADKAYVMAQGKIKINFGGSVSLITHDLHKGLFTVEQLDSVAERRIVDPYKYRNLITLNSSTVVPGKPCMASFAGGSFNFKKNTFSIDYKFTGSAYTSLGNPYVRSDQKSVTAEDRILLFNRKVTTSFRYLWSINDLSSNLGARTTTNGYMAYTFINPGNKWPQFNLFASYQERYAKSDVTVLWNADDQLRMIGGGSNYTFKTKKVLHTVDLQYTQSGRSDYVNKLSENSQQIYSAGIGEKFSNSFLIYLNYSRSEFQRGGIDKKDYISNYTVRNTVSFKKIKTDLTLDVMLSEMISATAGNSNRQTMSGKLTKYFKWNMVLELEYGYSPFRDAYYPFTSYIERYLRFSLVHNFNS